MIATTSLPPISQNADRGTHEVVVGLLERERDCKKLLDIPCGRGAFSQEMLARGFDVRSADCEELIELPEARFCQADMNERLPFADGELDAVVCIDGIEHIENPFAFVAECRRIVRPGGSVVLTTPNISSLRSRWRWLCTGFHNKCKTPLDEADPNPLHHINMLDLPKLRYMLHTRGLRLTGVTTNRIKPVAWLFAPLLPLCWLLTAWVFHREVKDPEHRRRCREIRRQMFSMPVLFGEALIVRAERPA